MLPVQYDMSVHMVACCSLMAHQFLCVSKEACSIIRSVDKRFARDIANWLVFVPGCSHGMLDALWDAAAIQGIVQMLCSDLDC